MQMPAPPAVMLGLPLERLRNLGGVEFRGLSPEASEVSLLQGDAYSWWRTTVTGRATEDVTWDFFYATFRRKYLGVRYLDDRKREFMVLVHGRSSVSEYEVRFVRLSQYAPELIPDERARCVGCSCQGFRAESEFFS